MNKRLNYSAKFLTFALCLMMLLAFFPKARAAQYESDSLKRASEDKITVLEENVILHEQKFNTLANGDGVTATATNVWTNNSAQWVDLAGDNKNVKVVTWSRGDANGWAASTVRTTIEDFERKNPGWLVVAGVNGDFFDINGTKEPTNSYIQYNGEVYRTGNASNNTDYRGSVGWKEDGSVVTGILTYENKQTLYVYDENGNATTLNVAGINTTPSETGITLLTVRTYDTYDLTGYTVYTGMNSAYRVSNANGSTYLKGNIKSVAPGTTGMTTTKGYFYLVAKDGSLDNLISEGTTIKIQQNATGDWADVKSSCGYIYKTIENGNPLHYNSSDDFAYTTHPRTLVGFKDDGSTVLMVIDGRGKHDDYLEGASLYQCGEMMKVAGCTSAYNVDGGGSSTLVVRNKVGGFDVVNTPSDGAERSIGNAILFVTPDKGIPKDNGISANGMDATRTTITVSITDEMRQMLSNVKVQLGERTFNIPDTDKTLIIDGLTENTSYDLYITYGIASTFDNTKIYQRDESITVKTKDFVYPASGLDVGKLTDTSIEFIKKPYQQAENIRDVILYFNGEPYNMGSSSSYTVNNLFIDTEYEYYFTYNVYDELTTNLYPATSAANKVKTLAYKLPIVESFEEYRISGTDYTFKYKYVDDSEIVTSAYLLVNDDKIDLSKKSATIKVENVDLTKSSYEIKLVLEYNGEFEVLTIESTPFSYDKIIVKLPPVIELFDSSLKNSKDYTFTYRYNAMDMEVTSAYLLFKETKYSLTNKDGSFDIANMPVVIGNNEVKLVLEYLDNSEKKTVEKSLIINVLAPKAPVIEIFTETSKNDTSYTYSYQYTDEDNVVKKAYILVNDTKYELTESSGIYTVEGIKLTENSYTVKLILEYEEDSLTKTVASTALTYDKVEETTKKGCKKKSVGELIISLTIACSLAFIILRKK